MGVILDICLVIEFRCGFGDELAKAFAGAGNAALYGADIDGEGSGDVFVG